MSVNVIPHLNFRGDARPALTFYHAVFGGHLTVVTYADAHHVPVAAEAGQVIWGQVAADSGFRIMAFDVSSDRPWHPGENACFVVLEGQSAAEVRADWDKLSEGAAILQPLSPSPWSPLYGMLKDRFGVTWVLSVAGADNAS